MSENFLDGIGDKPISWWMFEDATTPSLDGNTTNGNDLSWSGGDAQSSEHIQGSYGLSMPFGDATRAFGSVSSNFPFKAAVTGITTGGWCKFSDPAGSTNGLVFVDGFVTGFSIMATNGGGQAVWNLWPGHQVAGGPDLRNQQWHHVVGTWDSTLQNQQLWVDGTKANNATTTAVNLVTAGALTLTHCIGTGTMYYDEVFVFDKELTDAQIVSIYTWGLAGSSWKYPYQESEIRLVGRRS
jgi:hypothetical protein